MYYPGRRPQGTGFGGARAKRLPLHGRREGKFSIGWSHILTFGVAREGKIQPVEGLIVVMPLAGQLREQFF